MLILSIVTYKFYIIQFPILLNITKWSQISFGNINIQKVLGNFWKNLMGTCCLNPWWLNNVIQVPESSEACIRIGYIVKIGFHISRERIDFPIKDVGTI